jgi:hypothetical protein
MFSSVLRCKVFCDSQTHRNDLAIVSDEHWIEMDNNVPKMFPNQFDVRLYAIHLSNGNPGHTFWRHDQVQRFLWSASQSFTSDLLIESLFGRSFAHCFPIATSRQCRFFRAAAAVCVNRESADPVASSCSSFLASTVAACSRASMARLPRIPSADHSNCAWISRSIRMRTSAGRWLIRQRLS